jgi:hypothetical protein
MDSVRFARLATIGVAMVLLSAAGPLKIAGAQEDVATATASVLEVATTTSTVPQSPTETSFLTPTVPPTETPTVVPTSTPTTTPVSPTNVSATDLAAVDPSSTPTPTSIPDSTTTATPIPKVTIRIDSRDVDFGEVNASGDVDPSVDGVTSYPVNGGAWYIKERAIRVTVDSYGPWIGTCWATDNGLEKQLSWRLNGTEVWTAFQSNSSDAVSCFGVERTGSATFEFDLRIWVPFEADPRPFTSELRFKVEPISGA